MKEIIKEALLNHLTRPELKGKLSQDTKWDIIWSWFEEGANDQGEVSGGIDKCFSQLAEALAKAGVKPEHFTNL